MGIVVILFTLSILAMHLIGLAWTHIVIITCFAASIFFGALVIADSDNDEKKGNMYNDFGQPAKEVKGEG